MMKLIKRKKKNCFLQSGIPFITLSEDKLVFTPTSLFSHVSVDSRPYIYRYNSAKFSNMASYMAAALQNDVALQHPKHLQQV